MTHPALATQPATPAQQTALERVSARPLSESQPGAENGSGGLLASPSGPDSTSARLILRTGSDIQPEPIEWLWQGWLARGKMCILAGPPGTGKTTVALAIAAALSVGGRFPGGDRAPKLRTLIWSGEDGAADTLVPRLLAMGADTSRVSFIEGISDPQGVRPFDPAHDVALLGDALSRLDDVGLIVVDPIVSAVSGDSNKGSDVRRDMQGLVDMAAAKGCAVLGISHFTKGTAGRDPVERVTGSIAFGALARVVLAAAKVTDPVNGQTSRLLARAKSNVGPDGGGFKYDLEQFDVPGHAGIQASRVVWGDAVEGTARELLGQADEPESLEQREERTSAKDFVRGEMTAGELRPCTLHGGEECRVQPAAEMLRAAERIGIKARTAQNAATRMGVKPIKSSMSGGWEWHLAEGATDPRRREGATSGYLASSCAFEAESAPSEPPDAAEVL